MNEPLSEYWAYADPQGAIKIYTHARITQVMREGGIAAEGWLWRPEFADWRPVRGVELTHTTNTIDPPPPRGKRRRRSGRVALLAGVGVIVALGVYASITNVSSTNSDDGPPSSPLSEQQPHNPAVSSLTPVGLADSGVGRNAISDALRTVVFIEAMTKDGLSRGSGFFVRPDGLIVTNQHVIEGADVIRVEMTGAALPVPATLVAAHNELDLALISIPRSGMHFLELASSEGLGVGDEVFALGSPLGLRNTVSNGILSANRRISGVDYLQISAPISPGSSGGPLIRADGKAVGVVVATLEEGQNLNFAIPSDYVTALLATSDHRTGPSQSTSLPIQRIERGDLSDSDETLDDGSKFDAYPLILKVGDHLSLRLRSEDFDPFLILVKPSEEVVTNDDFDDSGLNAGMEIEIDQSGTWYIGVTSYDAGERGAYILTIQER